MSICDSDDKKVIDIKPEVCCEICNNSNIQVKPEVGDTTSNAEEDLRLQNCSDDKTNIVQSGDQPQNVTGEVQIKQVDSDSDIEVDLAYRIIDTFNVCDVKTFKQENETISSDTKTSSEIGLQNDHNQTDLKVEADSNTAIVENLDYKISNDLNGSEYDENKNPVYQLHSKGM